MRSKPVALKDEIRIARKAKRLLRVVSHVAGFGTQHDLYDAAVLALTSEFREGKGRRRS